MVGFLAPPKSPKLIKIWLFFLLILKVELNGNNLFYNHFICLHLNLWFTCSSFCRYCHLNFFPKWADSCIQAASIDDTVLLLYRRVISAWSWDGFVDGQGGWFAPPYTSTAINRPLLTDFQCHSIKPESSSYGSIQDSCPKFFSDAIFLTTSRCQLAVTATESLRKLG